MNLQRRQFLATCGLLLGMTGGCSDSKLQLVKVSGKVTLDGKPVPNSRLTFTAISDHENHGASGSANENGEYLLKAIVPGALQDYDGVPPGEYRVSVFEYNMLTLPAASAEETPGPAATPASANQRNRIIPLIYSSDQSPIIVTVPDSDSTIDIQMTAQPQRKN